jgi:hypothetical protein
LPEVLVDKFLRSSSAAYRVLPAYRVKSDVPWFPMDRCVCFELATEIFSFLVQPAG